MLCQGLPWRLNLNVRCCYFCFFAQQRCNYSNPDFLVSVTMTCSDFSWRLSYLLFGFFLTVCSSPPVFLRAAALRYSNSRQRYLHNDKWYSELWCIVPIAVSSLTKCNTSLVTNIPDGLTRSQRTSPITAVFPTVLAPRCRIDIKYSSYRCWVPQYCDCLSSSKGSLVLLRLFVLRGPIARRVHDCGQCSIWKRATCFALILCIGFACTSAACYYEIRIPIYQKLWRQTKCKCLIKRPVSPSMRHSRIISVNCHGTAIIRFGADSFFTS